MVVLCTRLNVFGVRILAMSTGLLHYGHMLKAEAVTTLESRPVILPGAPPASSTTALILGPHPGNGTFSISNYFTFWKHNLGPELPGFHIGTACPGDSQAFDRAVLRESPRITSWRQNYIEWPWRLRSMRADIFHIIDQGLGWYGRYLRGGRRLITVHDLITYLNWTGHLDFEKVTPWRAILLKESIAAIRKADHLISVSGHTADCLVRYLDVDASKITVVHNFISRAFTPLDPAERGAIRQRWFGSAEHVVLHVGKAFAYKNRLGALAAFARVRKSLPDAVMYLVSDPATAQELAFVREVGCEASVHFLSALSQSDLREIYGCADVLIFPSRYEGFGWPPLEAMACGCPVVATTCGSLGEVVGDAALTVPDPDDHKSLAEHLESILRDRKVADELRSRGFERVKKFLPEVVLDQVAEVYRSLVVQR